MRMYECGNCGKVMDIDAVDWRREKYDQEAAGLYPFCPDCGSDDVAEATPCEMCEEKPGQDFLGDYYLCPDCANRIREAVNRKIDELEAEEGLDWKTAKEWVLAWASANW